MDDLTGKFGQHEKPIGEMNSLEIADWKASLLIAGKNPTPVAYPTADGAVVRYDGLLNAVIERTLSGQEFRLSVDNGRLVRTLVPKQSGFVAAYAGGRWWRLALAVASMIQLVMLLEDVEATIPKVAAALIAALAVSQLFFENRMTKMERSAPDRTGQIPIRLDETPGVRRSGTR